MNSYTDKILKSSLVMVAANWIQRLFGIVSLLVLARILDPSDFGIAALSFVVVSFFEAISVTGGQQYILSRKTVSSDDLNVAFTLNLMMKSIVSLLVFLSAPYAASLFNDLRLEAVLQVVAIIPVINAMANPGVFQKQRNYEYRAIAVIKVLTKLVSFAVVLTLALKFQTYWALIAGNLMTASTRSYLGYFIHPHRPRLRITGIEKQWGFSKWMLARSIVGFSRAKADQFIVGIAFNTNIVGAYNVSKELVLMPFGQIAEPLSPIFLSMFAGSKDSIEALRRSYSVKFIIMFAIMLPITIGVYLLRFEIVDILLGEKWIGAELLIGALSPLILTYTLSASSSAILVIQERMRFLFILEVATLLVIILGQVAARELPIEYFAMVRSLLGLLTFVIYFLAVKYSVSINYGYFAIGLVPIFLAALMMPAFLVFLKTSLEGIYLVLASGIAGGTVYLAACSFFMWLFRQHSDVDFVRSLVNSYASRVWERFMPR